MTKEFKVGDRVILRPPKWDPEMTTTKYGIIEEVYNSKPSCHGPGEVLLAVRWDEGDLERGYLPIRLEPEPIPFPSFQVVE